jgi:PAS domain S-box-containing protein
MNLENEFRYTAPIYTGQFHRAVHKGRKDLLAIVEKGFAEISRKEHKAIEKKWLGAIIPAPPYLTYIFYALGLLTVLGGIILLWNYFLRREVARKTIQINKMLSVLQESEAKLRLLSDNLPGGIVYQIEVDERGEERRFTHVSAGVQQLHGISVTEALNDPMAMYGQIIEEDRHLLTERETYALANMSPFSTDVRIKVPSGEIKWISLSSSPRRISNNYVIWDGIEIDITKRKTAEEALTKSYIILNSVMESPRNVVIFALDREYRYIAFNENHRKTMKQIWGVDISLGNSMLEYILNPHDTSKAKINFDRALLGESFIILEEYGDTVLERRYYEDIYNPIIDESGGVMGLTLFLTDITDLKRGEEEHEKLQAQLLQSQKMESIGRLAGGVAHDFNNMLSVIIGYSELAMRETPSTDKLYFNLQEIRKAAKRSADLTRQLLAFASRQTVAPKFIDLNEIVEGILQMLRRLIGEDIDLIWRPDPSILPIYMDPSQIDQILTNLCVNARDAIKGVGKMVIETRSVVLDETFRSVHPEAVPGEYVLLSVNDNGCGMDKETLNRLFEPFFTTKENGQGTGLGLATIYGIVKQNGGFIYAESMPGQGATFSIYLPGHAAKTSFVQCEPLAASPASGLETILLVEDEPAILDLGIQMLTTLGYLVLSASTPGEAVRLAGDHAGEINLLITDVIMPEMNGRDLAKTIMDLRPGLRCLFMSGYTDDIISYNGAVNETVNFIQKPFSLDELAAKVREAIENKK